jgi:hypothetical protein
MFTVPGKRELMTPRLNDIDLHIYEIPLENTRNFAQRWTDTTGIHFKCLKTSSSIKKKEKTWHLFPNKKKGGFSPSTKFTQKPSLKELRSLKNSPYIQEIALKIQREMHEKKFESLHQLPVELF